MVTEPTAATSTTRSAERRPKTMSRQTARARDCLVIAVFTGVILLWAAWGSFLGIELTSLFGGDKDVREGAGQFGDMFGSLNALFTALAFAAVWWTGRMQRREMEMQRRELRLQRKALSLQRGELADTRSVVTRQTFESMFFQMLRLSREIRDAVQAPDSQAGTYATQYYANQCRNIIERERAEPDVDELRRKIGISYQAFVYDGEAEPYIGPYFRSLFHVFKLIDETPFRSDVKARYANIARAQLSADDLVVLATNACSDVGAGFRRHIHTFGILKHYPRDGSRPIIERCFDGAAFPPG